MTTVHDALQLALAHHRRHELEAAEQIYQQIVVTAPGFADAHHLLGVLATQRGDHAVAYERIRRAIELNPNEAAYHGNLGVVLQHLGRDREALASFQASIARNRDFVDGYSNLANLQQKLGLLEEAVASFQEAIRIQPRQATFHSQLGWLWLELGKPESARESFQAAIALDTNCLPAMNGLASILLEEGELERAVSYYQQALSIAPDYADALANLGCAYQQLDRLVESVTALERAFQLSPDQTDIAFNLGRSYELLGQYHRAREWMERVLAKDPMHVEALGILVHLKQHLCQWEGIEAASQRVIDIVESEPPEAARYALHPSYFVFLPTPTSPATQHRCAVRWSDRHLRPYAHQQVAHRNRSRKDGRLRIGYVSADYRQHVMAYHLPQWLEEHDRGALETFGYSIGPTDTSRIRHRIVQAFDHFFDGQTVTIAQLAARIEEDEIDILVDLQGHTLFSRPKLFALRPAPIQVTYLGFPGTFGSTCMDYVFVDDFIVPAGDEIYFSEKLVYLPGCYQVNDRHLAAAPFQPSRRDCGLREDAFVFCSFNNWFKLTPRLFAIWMKLLRQVPGSVLWIPDRDADVRGRLMREAARHGVTEDRIVFAPQLPLEEHLARHRLADLFLDTFPYNAHGTASISLRMGVPIVTMSGKTMVSRVAGSLLRAVGLDEWIATNEDEYEERALRLAFDEGLLRTVREQLRREVEHSSLFDGRSFARHTEAAYRQMWEHFVAGRGPQPIRVSPSKHP